MVNGWHRYDSLFRETKRFPTDGSGAAGTQPERAVGHKSREPRPPRGGRGFLTEKNLMPGRIAILCTREKSPYQTIAQADPWPKSRDMRNYRGGSPAVCHPPCGQWGRLRAFARKCQDEKSLGPLCVEHVRRGGGVIEHPAYSTLWDEMEMAKPGCLDAWGGRTLPVIQWFWGHRAAKASWLYIVGCRLNAVPEIPFRLGEPTHRCGGRKDRPGFKPVIGRKERERTPVEFAVWLVEVAKRCQVAKRV